MRSSTPTRSRAAGCWGLLGPSTHTPTEPRSGSCPGCVELGRAADQCPPPTQKAGGRGQLPLLHRSCGGLATPELGEPLSGASDPCPRCRRWLLSPGPPPRFGGLPYLSLLLQPPPTGTLPDPPVGEVQPCCTLKSPGKFLIPTPPSSPFPPPAAHPRRWSLTGSCEPGIWRVHKSFPGDSTVQTGGGYCSPPKRPHSPAVTRLE